MKICKSVTYLETILCLLVTFSIQEMCHHDKGGHITGYKGQIQEGHSLHCCGNLTYNISGSSCCNEIYQMKTHLCCVDTIFELGENLFCCGNNLYNRKTHSCTKDLQVKPNLETCCSKMTDVLSTENSFTKKSAGSTLIQSKQQPVSTSVSPPTKVSDLMCASKDYNPQESICCSGNPYRKTSALTKCCGKDIYSLLDETVLCCNGKLHRNLPEQSECVGGVVYTPGETACQLYVRPRLGEHCCGEKTLNPEIHICCNGHRYNKKNVTFCCGSKAYDPYDKSWRCCSGHLYATRLDGKAECCGTLLLEDNTYQTCCSSTSHAMLYENQPKHMCCGNNYYNTSLWSCCAGHLKPTPKTDVSHTELSLKPLMELIPDICSKKVLFGKVESVALNSSQRNIVLRVFVRFHVNTSEIKDPWLNVALDHCSSPALEHGMTYLWEINNSVYKPLSHPIDQNSDIHMLLTMLQLYEGCSQK
ncbi:galaxin-like isoform X2 [Xyrauchen texanus]|uniref:galaxin-like isoform X2 n=1 Tax=Xyrauchen texanus TaxID=154827 RepID=UPI0022420881|nr:galaxin-like isoform X2 [Xyrauchen texanus]